jgi:hypothetical protein
MKTQSKQLENSVQMKVAISISYLVLLAGLGVITWWAFSHSLYMSF